MSFDDLDDNELLILASEQSNIQQQSIREQPGQHQFDFMNYRNPPESVASTVASTVASDVDFIEDTTGSSWFTKINYMFAGNMPAILKIIDDEDKNTILYMIENCFSEDSYTKMNKLFSENQIRDGKLDSKICLSDDSFIILQVLINAFGISSFKNVCEIIAMRVNCQSSIERMHVAFKFFVTACQQLLSVKLGRDKSEIEGMQRKYIDIILSLKNFEFADYFQKMMGSSLCAYAYEAAKMNDYYCKNRKTKGSLLTAGEYGLYFFILKNVYKQIDPEWNSEKKCSS